MRAYGGLMQALPLVAQEKGTWHGAMPPDRFGMSE